MLLRVHKQQKMYFIIFTVPFQGGNPLKSWMSPPSSSLWNKDTAKRLLFRPARASHFKYFNYFHVLLSSAISFSYLLLQVSLGFPSVLNSSTLGQYTFLCSDYVPQPLSFPLPDFIIYVVGSCLLCDLWICYPSVPIQFEGRRKEN